MKDVDSEYGRGEGEKKVLDLKNRKQKVVLNSDISFWNKSLDLFV